MSKHPCLYYVFLATLLCKWSFWMPCIYADTKVQTSEKIEAENQQAQGRELENTSPQEKKDTIVELHDTEEEITIQEKNKEQKTEVEKKDKEKKDTKKEDKKDEKEKKDTKKKEKPKKSSLSYTAGDSEYRFWVKLRMPDFTYGKNLRLLNDDNPSDRLIFIRHTLDFNLEYRYGNASRDYDVVFAKLTVRNRGIWGDPESIAFTTFSTIRETDAVFGEHRHAIPRHILWIRELWLQFSLTDLLCLPFCNSHTLTLGAFPFELGRGIALGSSYAVDATDLGFFTENGVDQYAFGGKLSGDLIKDILTYDVYGAFLDNRSDTFDNTSLKIRAQQFGHRNDQARGFGIINYVVATRLRWTPKTEPWAKIRLEPYVVYNHNPEQRIEFTGDAKSDLGTAGMAGEFEIGNFEFGFDTAFNFGRQTVFGFDRNIIERENRKGTVSVVNTRVRQAPPGEEPNPRKSPLALKVKENQSIIDTSPRAASENGQIIGTNKLGTLINDSFRFTDPYTNSYDGYMFMYDMSYYFCKPDFKISAELGYASGDANPNRDAAFPGDSEIDGEYDGFIGLLETYSGTRVKSAFLLNGAGKIPRPLDFPSQEVFEPFVSVVSRFTNILFTGAGFTWQPSWSCRKWSVNPNVIAYWQDFPPRIFNRQRERPGIRTARSYLGTELNIFVEAQLLEDLKFFLVSSLFLPGSLYNDIKGLPLTKAQQSFLDNFDEAGIINDRVPFVGNDPSFYINTGLEYRF